MVAMSSSRDRSGLPPRWRLLLIPLLFLAGFGTQTLPVKMYDSIVLEISPVLSAISVLLTLLALVICVTITIIHNPDKEQEVTQG